MRWHGFKVLKHIFRPLKMDRTLLSTAKRNNDTASGNMGTWQHGCHWLPAGSHLCDGAGEGACILPVGLCCGWLEPEELSIRSRRVS